MPEEVRVRFAPSPTGQVHIGNIRTAIFNWLFARHHREQGKFLLRIEDTDLERSTPEAIAALFETLEWLGLKYDEPPVHQTAQRPRHEYEADRLLNLDHAYHNSDATPAVVFKMGAELYDPSFVTEPREEVEIDTSKVAALRATLRSLVLCDKHEKTGQEYLRPMPWDAISAGLTFHLENGSAMAGEEVLKAAKEKCGKNLSEERSCDVTEITEGKVSKISFKRRYVYFEDLILGRREKPLEDLRDFVIVRGDGSPVFHLANVIDDATMKITHILRGNDHIENTFRHLFLFKAIGTEPPAYGHFPMIVNALGKPYSKRDGDAYVGDFREKGFLAEALFNFLALCGWSPGDDREKMGRTEMAEAFTLERVKAAPAQFNIEKLEWLNGQLLMETSDEELMPIFKEEVRRTGGNPDEYDNAWWNRVTSVEKKRLRTTKEFFSNTHYLFTNAIKIDWEEKNIKKVFKKPEAKAALTGMLAKLTALNEWTEEALDKVVHDFVEETGFKMGMVAQPLRVAVTGGTSSPGINETLFLVGKELTVKRIESALTEIPENKE